MAIGKVLSSDRDWDVVSMGWFHDLFWQFQLICFFLKFECFQSPSSSITTGALKVGRSRRWRVGKLSLRWKCTKKLFSQSF